MTKDALRGKISKKSSPKFDVVMREERTKIENSENQGNYEVPLPVSRGFH